MADRKAELERKKERLRQMREEKERRRKEKEKQVSQPHPEEVPGFLNTTYTQRDLHGSCCFSPGGL